MVAKSPWKTHRYLKFDPSGLGQTYRDQTTGAELPVFAVFNLEGRRELRADIGMDRTTVFDASLNPNAVSDSALECFGRGNNLLWPTGAPSLIIRSMPLATSWASPRVVQE
jgi:hypothetical protein